LLMTDQHGPRPEDDPVFARRFFVEVPSTEEDLVRASAIPADGCPRRYCWWWISLGFEWNLTPSEGCTFLKTKFPSCVRFTDVPCCRSDPSSPIDHFETREPHLDRDEVDPSRWLEFREKKNAGLESQTGTQGSERHDLSANQGRTFERNETVARNYLDRAGRSALHDAVVWNPHEVPYLIRSGADVNLKDANGYTPLHFAAQEQSVEITRLLLDAGAKVDERDHHGNTPLSNAVFHYRGDGSLIELLRERGADPFAKNNYGSSPVELARSIANYDVAKFFDDLPKCHGHFIQSLPGI
jgi:hypothetical protein